MIAVIIDPAILQIVLNFLEPALLVVVTAAVGYLVSKGKVRDRQLQMIKSTAEATHKLSNGAMGAQLTNAVHDAEQQLVLFKIIADIRRSPADAEAVTAATLKVEQRKKLLQEHLIRQASAEGGA